MAKRDLSAAVKKGASQQPPTPIEDRFVRGAKTLDRLPTGYSAPVEVVPAVGIKSRVTEEQNGDSVPVSTHLSAATTAGTSHHLAIPSRLGIPVFEEVSLDLIDDNPYNARHFYLPDRVDAIAKSLRKEGQLVPGIASRTGDRLTLIAGHFRKRAAIQEGFKTLKLMVYPRVSPSDLYLLSYKENEEHTPQSAIDDAFAWKKLQEDGLYEYKDIASLLDILPGRVTATMSFLRLDENVKDVIKQSPAEFGASVIYALAQLQGAGAPLDLVLECALKVPEGHISRREIDKIRAQYDAPRTRRKKENSRQYRIKSDSYAGVIKEWDTGKIILEITCPNSKDREVLVRELRSKFELHEDKEVS